MSNEKESAENIESKNKVRVEMAGEGYESSAIDAWADYMIDAPIEEG